MLTAEHLIDTAARIAYQREFGQPWDNGSPIGHTQARDLVTPADVATIAADKLYQADLRTELLDAALDTIAHTDNLDQARGIAHAALNREEYHHA